MIGGMCMQRGKLKIFFSYFYKTAKTKAMLSEIIEKYHLKYRVLIIDAQCDDTQMNQEIIHMNHIVIDDQLSFNINSILKMNPEIVVIDQIENFDLYSIEKLLEVGINIYATLNVFNILSMNQYLSEKFNILTHEKTVPDYFFNQADEVEFIDIPPKELLLRLEPYEQYQWVTEENLKYFRTIALDKLIDHNKYSHKKLIESNLQFLVCISPSPSAIRSIEWTARNAQAFYASWKALYITTNKHKNNIQDIKKIEEYENKVHELGGEFVRITANNIDAAIIEYAKLTGVTNMVIGKSRTVNYRFPFRLTTLESKIINAIKGIELHIIPNYDYGTKKYEYKPKKTSSRVWKDILLSVLITLFATAICFLINFNTDEFNEGLIYLMAVLLISRFTKGYIYGIATSFISFLIFLYLFVQPNFTFNVSQVDSWVTFGIIFITSIMTSMITSQIKSDKESNVSAITELEKLYTFNQELLKVDDKLEIINLMKAFFKNEFGGESTFYDIDNNQIVNEPAQNDHIEAVQWMIINHQEVGNATKLFSNIDTTYFPIIISKKIIGAVSITGLNLQTFKDYDYLIRVILYQTGLAIEKETLKIHRQKLSEIASQEIVRSNLLRSVSHDLRTPLTSIYGMITTIIEQETITRDEIVNNLASARDDIQWLIRMIENLLSITRINQETQKVMKNLEVVEEIVSESVIRVRKRFPKAKIKVKIPNDVLLVPMDGTLIEQVIINLLENTIKHGKNVQNIILSVDDEQDKVIFKVSDDGKYIDLNKIENLLKDTQTIEYGDKGTKHSGIGLLICKTIIQAHQGQFSFYKNQENGITFYFTLPKGDHDEFK
ncbi:Two components response regulator, sensor histidine kinase KdpD [Alteracholeplasma palmae J233]|uniref:histidine kinase n=2 Tax=Acholeplasma palmae TaxID=38986 RepID=U4KQI1_ALTPJ|nr:Two components response regulator, sensor histidine kinase KdpD [Alteracholeplasma palmae J233]